MLIRRVFSCETRLLLYLPAGAVHPGANRRRDRVTSKTGFGKALGGPNGPSCGSKAAESWEKRLIQGYKFMETGSECGIR